MNSLSATAHTSPLPLRLLIYAHFDPENIIREYVLHTLRCMSKVCTEIRFVSTSALPESELAKIRPYVTETLEVENTGLDFNMWKCSLQSVTLTEYDELVTMNSSVYGPLFDISTVFDSMQAQTCDCWGITDNYDPDWHLQSYFIVFRKAVLSSPAFKIFWDSVLPYKNKRQIIRSYEIGLSQWMLGQGFTLCAYCSWNQLVRYLAAHPDKSRIIPPNQAGIRRIYKQVTRSILKTVHHMYIRPVNPSVAFPEELIALHAPFLKHEVLRENPYNRNISGIMAALEALDYPKEYLLTYSTAAAATDGILTSRSERCPLCGSSGKVRRAALSDCFALDSAGVWNIRQCQSPDCGAAWLDPAPLESEIHKAYRTYYTHGSTAPIACHPHEYSHIDLFLLKIARRCLNRLQLDAQRETYWLHGLQRGDGRLLEIGCGDGSRLVALKKLGWSVEGQEIDPKAASNCRSKDLVIHEGDIKSLSLPESSYDVILMSHVIEHVYNPVEFLANCRKLLKPGGRLILSTPNFGSFGHRIYKRSWRPLEVPRHIIIYNRNSLSTVLQRAGFSHVSVKTVALNCELIAMHSRDIEYFGWTDMNSSPRVGKEVIPLLMQLMALIVHFFLRGSGEECYAVAENHD